MLYCQAGGVIVGASVSKIIVNSVIKIIFVNVFKVLFSVSKNVGVFFLRLDLLEAGVWRGLDPQQSPADRLVLLQHHPKVSVKWEKLGNGEKIIIIPVPLLCLQLGNILFVFGVLDGHALTLTVQLLDGRLPLIPTLLRRDFVSLSTSAALLIVLRGEVVSFSLDAQVAGLTVFRGSSDVLCDFHLESLLHELRMIVSS